MADRPLPGERGMIPACSVRAIPFPDGHDHAPKSRPRRPEEPILTGATGDFDSVPYIERRKKSRPVRGAPAAPARRFYRVRPGDTLYGVSRQFGLPVDTLCAANGVSRDDSLAVGRRLRIPSRSGKATSAQRRGVSAVPRPAARESLAGAPRFIWPVRRVGDIRRDGERGVRPIGIIIESSPGLPVISSARGVVEKIGTMRGFGQYVIIKHGGHYLTVYSRLNGINVSEGDTVGRGGVIGRQGGELHFQINRSGRALNPLELLPDRS